MKRRRLQSWPQSGPRGLALAAAGVAAPRTAGGRDLDGAVARTAPEVTTRRELRPEIQALRAVAVLLVVLAHYWPSVLPGGFIGVDVFFAISGYLITSHLLREVDRTSAVSLAGFWARRARRLLPASLLTLLVCGIATAIWVPINYWEQFFNEIRASIVYGENWYLADQAVDYFAQENGPSPVQHFWSLSAEEQFYLAWPVLIIGALGLTRGRAMRVRRGAIAGVLAAVTLGSLAFSIAYTEINPESAYFVTPTRAWEFGAGGLLALVPATMLAARSRAVLAWAGLAAIVAAAVLYTEKTPFPGYAALLPILGALAVMRAGAPTSGWAPTGLMSRRPVQFLGDVSYSVYLWHWPLLILPPFALGRELNDYTKVAFIMLSILLAWLTKLFVEDPVRRGALTRRRPRTTFLAVALAMGAMLGLTACASAYMQDQVREAAAETQAAVAAQPKCFGAASRDPEKRCNNPRLAKRVVPTPLEATKLRNGPCREGAGEVSGKRICAFGASKPKAEATIALIGDSHAGHWKASMDVVARRKNWYGMNLGHASCPLSTATRDIPEPNRSSCIRWKDRVFAWFKKHPEVTTVFVSQLTGGSGVVPANGKNQFETAVSGYIAAWKKLPKTVEHVIVIRDTPKVRGNTDACVQSAMRAGKRAGIACAVSRAGAIDADPAAVAAKRTKVERVGLIDMNDFFCDKRRCYPVVGGVLTHEDSTHMTGIFGGTLAPYLQRATERIMDK